MNNKENLKIMKYLIVAITSVIIDLILSGILFYIFNIDYTIASNIALLISTLFNYSLSIFFVFNVKNDYISFLIYLITFILGIGMTNLSLFIMYKEIGISFAAAKILTFGIVFIQNYVLRNMLYKKHIESQGHLANALVRLASARIFNG